MGKDSVQGMDSWWSITKKPEGKIYTQRTEVTQLQNTANCYKNLDHHKTGTEET